MSLHSRITTALDRLDPQVRAALDPHAVHSWDAGEERRYAHYRRILARHTPVTITYPITLTICAGCSLPNGQGGWGVGEAFYGLMPADRCRELPDLAEALGVSIEETPDA